VVGSLVKECEARACRLADLSAERLDKVLPGKGGALGRALGVTNAVQAFQSYGSTAPDQVEKQLAEWKTRLA
jgi:argininosuccinate lyase